jgi:hypothetical protein
MVLIKGQDCRNQTFKVQKCQVQTFKVSLAEASDRLNKPKDDGKRGWVVVEIHFSPVFAIIYPVSFCLVGEPPLCNIEQLRCLRHVAMGVFQGVDDHFPFQVGHGIF